MLFDDGWVVAPATIGLRAASATAASASSSSATLSLLNYESIECGHCAIFDALTLKFLPILAV